MQLFRFMYLVHFLVLFDVRNDDFLQRDSLIREQDFDVIHSMCWFAKFDDVFHTRSIFDRSVLHGYYEHGSGMSMKKISVLRL